MSPCARLAHPRLALAVLIAAAALVLSRSGTPEPAPADAPPGDFSAARAAGALARVLGDQAPRPSGSPAHASALERLRAELTELGLEHRLERTVVQRAGSLAVVRNLLASIPGRDPGPGAAGVLLVAHHDSVAAGPGAADDGAGVAVLLETARALLHGERPRRDVMLLFTDGEEDGLLGAQAFCRDDPWLERTGVVLNFEARGSGGPSMLFQTSGPNRWLLARAAGALPRPWTSSVADLVYRTMPNDTDLSVFVEAGVPGVNFAFIDGLARYHTPRDELEHLDLGSLQHHGDSALALARALGELQLESASGSVARGEQVPRGQPPGRAAFFDLLGLGVVAWPLAWSLPLAVVALALGLSGLARSAALERVGRASLVAAAARALAPTLGALLLAVLLGSAGPWLAARVAGVPLLAHAHPWAPAAACAGGVLLGLALVPPRPPRERRSDGALAALWAVWALFSLGALAASVARPEVAYLPLAPAAAMGALALLVPRRPAAAQLAALATAALLWLPIVHGLRLGFGFALPPLVATPLALVGLWLRPALSARTTAAGRRARPSLPAAAGALALAGTAATVFLPAATSELPGWLTLRYELGLDGAARLEAESGGAALPPELAGLARFEPAGASAAGSLHRAAVPPPSEPLAGPAIALAPAADGALRVRLAPAHPGSRLALYFDTPVRAAGRLAGHDAEAGFPDGEGPLPALLVTGLDAEGVELELRGVAGEPVGPFLVGEARPGLPPVAEPFAAARPAHLVPRSRGDTTTTWTRVVP